MKTIISCSLAGLVLLANAANAGGLEGYGVPSNITPYAGASAGMASHEGACTAAQYHADCEDTSTGHKVFAGVRATPNANGFVATPAGVVPAAALPTLGRRSGLH